MPGSTGTFDTECGKLRASGQQQHCASGSYSNSPCASGSRAKSLPQPRAIGLPQSSPQLRALGLRQKSSQPLLRAIDKFL